MSSFNYSACTLTIFASWSIIIINFLFCFAVLAVGCHHQRTISILLFRMAAHYRSPRLCSSSIRRRTGWNGRWTQVVDGEHLLNNKGVLLYLATTAPVNFVEDLRSNGEALVRGKYPSIEKADPFYNRMEHCCSCCLLIPDSHKLVYLSFFVVPNQKL